MDGIVVVAGGELEADPDWLRVGNWFGECPFTEFVDFYGTRRRLVGIDGFVRMVPDEPLPPGAYMPIGAQVAEYPLVFALPGSPAKLVPVNLFGCALKMEDDQPEAMIMVVGGTGGVLMVAEENEADAPPPKMAGWPAGWVSNEVVVFIDLFEEE
jgi:hypothetical protein